MPRCRRLHQQVVKRFPVIDSHMLLHERCARLEGAFDWRLCDNLVEHEPYVLARDRANVRMHQISSTYVLKDLADCRQEDNPPKLARCLLLKNTITRSTNTGVAWIMVEYRQRVVHRSDDLDLADRDVAAHVDCPELVDRDGLHEDVRNIASVSEAEEPV